MGFFSSIGSVLGGIGGAILGGPAGAVIGSGLAGAVGGGVDTLRQHNYYSDQMDFARSQDAFNRQYVQNAIQWRVEDAKKAGVHPMAALGFQSPGYSGVSMPSIPGDSSTVDPGEFGQSLNYAAAKAKTETQQEQAFNLTKQGMELDNKGKQIQNEIAATQLLSMQAQLRNSGPAAPPLGEVGIIPGQGDSIKISPSELKASGSVGTQAGAPPSVQWYQNPDGSVVRSMSEQAKQVNEEDVVNTLNWHYDNNITPLLVRGGFDNGADPSSYAPPLSMLPKGAVGWRPSGYNKFVPVYDYKDRSAYYGPLK